MTRPGRGLASLLMFSGLIALGVGLTRSGVYGLAIFVAAPVLAGALASWTFRPAASKDALGLGLLVSFVGSLSLLATGLEGGLCILMALPLAMPLSAAGSWLAYAAQRSEAAPGSVAVLALIMPLSLTWDANVRPEVFSVRSSVEVTATPEQVWKNVISFPDLPEPSEWFFRGGIAYPQRARIVGTGVGSVRYCEFSTGRFVEPIQLWNEPRLLRFNVTENPPPMREWSPYSKVVPAHLSGHMISRQGEFRLTQLAGSRTLLEGTTWYQHGLWPATYWRWWSDAIIHRIHLRVLSHIRQLSEGDVGHTLEQNRPW